MRKKKQVIREGVALALSLALVGSGMNLSAVSVLAADQDDAFNPAVTSEGVAGWATSDKEQTSGEADKKAPASSETKTTVTSDKDSDKAPWNNIVDETLDKMDESNDATTDAETEDEETSDDPNAGIAVLSVVDDVLEEDSLEQVVSNQLINQIKNGNVGEFSLDLTTDQYQLLDWKKVFLTIARDCPFDLYWMDVENGLAIEQDNDKCKITLRIAKEYQDGPNGISANATKEAKSAKDSAQKIVNEQKNKDTKDMLDAYQKAICELTSYNEEQRDKYKKNPKDPTIDPGAWQPVYTFNGEAVVCEGYSKAFQYLCDSSDLPDNTKCYTVTGQMSGGTGAGGHMWNIVVIDGKSYLVDVTNSDAGTAGDPKYNKGTTPLFLAVPTSGSVEEGYTFELPSGDSIFYKYDEDTLNLYGKNSPILKLATTPADNTTNKPDKPNKPNKPNPNPKPPINLGEDGWPDKEPDVTVNPDWLNPGSTTNTDMDRDPNWTDENPTPGVSGSVSSNKNNSGSSTDTPPEGDLDVDGKPNLGGTSGNPNDGNNNSSNGTGNNTVSNTQASTSAPKTGDHNTIVLYMILMLLALGTIGSVCVIRQKKN